MTDLNRYIPAVIRYPLYEVNRIFYKTAYQGAQVSSLFRIKFIFIIHSQPTDFQTTLHCVLAPGVAQQGGEYFSDCAVASPKPGARDPADALRLWEISEKLVATH